MSTITLTTPGPSQRISIPAEPQATIHLDFQTDQATLERSGDNLVFSFADGGSIAIEGFYAQYDKTNLPEFAVDGKILPGSEFFSVFGPDLAPAAGPAAQAAERGARYNEHSDSSLASGLGHLDSAETPTLNVSAPAELATLDPTLAVVGGAELGGAAGVGSDNPGSQGPSIPPGPEGPTFPSGPFVRAVLYGNGQSGEYVSTNVFFAENNGTPSVVSASDLDFTGAAPWARFSVTATLPDGWQDAWVDVAFDYSTGRLEFRLTPEGIAEMQRLGVNGKPLVDFIQISVLDRGTGNTFDYNVELIATKDQTFDSAAHDSEYGGNIAGDNIGEFHQGQNGGGAYSIISSAKDDEIVLNDTVLGGSSIHASGSADPSLMADDYNTINLNAGVVNTVSGSTTQVTSTDGILKVQGGVSVQGDNAENVISMGKGQVHIHNASGHGIDAVGGENTILGRELNVDASGTGIRATDGGSNTVAVKGGDVLVDADGTALYAENDSSNTVSATGGSVNITSGEEGIRSNANSTSTVSTTDGDINIKSAWAGIAAYDNGTNNISTNNGSINIDTDTWGITTSTASAANVNVTNGSLNINALGRGIHSYENGVNTVSVTNGDVNVNSGWGWDGIIAHFGGTNNVAVDNGSVVINSGGTGMTAFYDSKNELAINNGSLHINSNYAGVNASFGENAINVNGGDVSISSTSAYDAGVLASENGKNTITTSGTLSVTAETTGISAENGGKNSLTGNDVSITASSKHGVYAADAGSTNEISAGTDGKVEISAGGSGLFAERRGANSVTGGDISITGLNYAVIAGSQSVNEIDAGAEGKVTINGARYGLYAGAEGKNAVNGGDITITSTENSNSRAAVFATGNNSANTITADSDGKIVINGGWGGLGAAQQGVNNVSGGDIAITSGTSSPAVFANGSGSSNNVDAGPDGKVVIEAYYEGLNANSGGSNTVRGGDITVTGNRSAALWAVNSGSNNSIDAGSNGKIAVNGYMSAQSGGVNNLSGGDVNVSGVSGASNGYGLYATLSGSNTISTADGHISVSGTSTSNNSYAMSAVSSGSNSITTESGDVTVTATSTTNSPGSSSYGMGASSGRNSITTASGDVAVAAASTKGSGAGMWAYDSGTVASNTIASESGNIEVTGSGAIGYGMNAASSGSNAITTITGDVMVSGAGNGPSGSSSAYGMYATSGRNSITTEDGNVIVSGVSSVSLGYGMSASNSGHNSIATESGNVEVSGSGSIGYGMHATVGENSITTADGRVTVSGTNTAMHASGGSNSISTEDGDVQVSGPIGMYNKYGTNSVTTANGNVTVSGTGTSNAVGMMSTGEPNNNAIAATPGSNVITTENGNITVMGTANTNNSSGFGMNANAAGNNVISTEGGTVNVTGNSTTGYGYGMHASNNGAVNSVTTAGGDVSVSGSGAAGTGFAMAAYSDGNNSISTTSGDVNILAKSTTSAGSGMYTSGGKNAVKTESGDVTVTGSSASGVGRGMDALSGANSVVTASGEVSISGKSTSGSSYGMSTTFNGQNTVTTEGGDVNVSSTASRSSYGMYTASTGANTITTGDGDVDVSAKSSGTTSNSYGMSVNGAGSNSIATKNGDIDVSGSGAAGYGLFSNATGGKNSVETEAGNISIQGTGTNGTGAGMFAQNAGSNSVTARSGDVTVAGSGAGDKDSYGMFASGADSSNSIVTQSGSVVAYGNAADSGSAYGMAAFASGSNRISTDSGSAVVYGIAESGESYGMVAQNAGTNSIETDSGAVMVESGSPTTSTGMWADSAGSANRITTTSGDIFLFADGFGSEDSKGMLATDSGINSIATQSGSTFISGGIHATTSGSNSVTARSGDVTITGSGTGDNDGFGMLASGAGSNNNVTTQSGSVIASVSGTGSSYAFGMAAVSSGKNNISTETGSVAISGTGNAGTGDGYGMFANYAGGNSIETVSGDVAVSSDSASRSYGMWAFSSGSKNSIVTDSGSVSVDASSSANGLSNGMFAENFGANSITTNGGTVAVSASNTGSGDAHGMHALNSGSNSIASAADIPLTVTITATAASAQKAIAMWAQGGGAVNYITGHSQAGGDGDSITLSGGIAMQTANGGRNIITTGAGNDHVTINGAVKGSGNQINVGGGSNTVTLNGAVESGSLNVIATDGTYTLILQASSTESFAERYGQWLNGITSDNLIAGGLTSISFDGLDVANLPADFLTTFNDLLYVLHDNGVSIVPDGLYGHLHDPAATAAPMMFAAADVAEHSGTDGIHPGASDDGQAAHAAGLGTVQGPEAPNTAGDHALDEAGSAAAIGSGGAESSHHDDSTGAQGTSAQGYIAADTHPATEHYVTGVVDHAEDGATHDVLQSQDGQLNTGAYPQLDTHLAENTDSVTLSTENGHEDSPVLDDLLSDNSFYGSENVGLLFHGDSLNQNADGPVAGATAGQQGEIHANLVLTLGDESLDGLFAEGSLSSGVSGDAHQYGESVSGGFVASLTDMPAVMNENSTGMHIAGGGDVHGVDGEASAPAWANAPDSAEHFAQAQESVNTAMRQIEGC